MGDDTNDPTRLPTLPTGWALAIMCGGAAVFPFLLGYVLSLFHTRYEDTHVPNMLIFIAALALGGLVLHVFLKVRGLQLERPDAG
jgi:hypothetical protein